MRRIYLIRHGKPDFPGDERYCLGQTDMPIGPEGRLQACLLGRELGGRGLTVFSSPLSRALSTAEYLSPAPVIIPGLTEMYAGDWDGLSFSEIARRWPELFSRRGLAPDIPIPNSEDALSGQARFVAAVTSALDSSRGDIAIAAHSTVNQYLICRALGVGADMGRAYKLRYGSYSVLDYDGEFHLVQMDTLPHPELDRELCLQMLKAYGCGDRIIAHCEAVAARSLAIAGALNAAGLCLDLSLIESAALLHDIARSQSNHAQAGGELAASLGYGELGDVIRQHHDPYGTEPTAAAVVYIADKCISESGHVTVDERFRHSLEKCSGPGALAAHKRRWAEAREIMKNINSLCGKEIIK